MKRSHLALVIGFELVPGMSSTTEQFDPYREWLGIDSHEQPADHYRLLGLARFESDVAKIAAVADERMASVRRFQVGPRGRYTQRLLNELSTAKVCLLSPAAKAAYDMDLARTMSATMRPHSAVPPIAPPPIGQADSKAVEPVAEPLSATPWWHIVLAITAAALVALVAVLAWGVARQRWKSRFEPEAVVREPEPVAPEPEPTIQEPTLQLQEGSGEVTLAAATAQITNDVELRHIGTREILGKWTGAGAAARWRFRLIQPGFFQLELKYATAAEALGSQIAATVGEQTKSIELRASGGLETFAADTVTIAIPNSGEHTLELALRQRLDGDSLLVESVRLIPVGGATPPVILPEEP
jgi:hypothetical protein